MADDADATVHGTLHLHEGKGAVRVRARLAAPVDTVWTAITDPTELAQWYGTVRGDLRVGGQYTAVITISGWDGTGQIDRCEPPRRLAVTMWEQVEAKSVVAIELEPDDGSTIIAAEVRGVPPEAVWAYGAGWHLHAEHLAAHVEGHAHPATDARWATLEAHYREAEVTALEP